MPPGAGLVDFLALEAEIANLLGCPVELVSDAGSSLVLDAARRNAIPLGLLAGT